MDVSLYPERELVDTLGWEDDPVLKGYVGSPYSPCRPNNVRSTALENRRQVKSGQTLLFGFTVLNTLAAAQFIQWFDREAAPAAGAVPDGVISVPASQSAGVAWTPTPRLFVQGLWLVNSSTAASLTAGAADCFFDVQFL